MNKVLLALILIVIFTTSCTPLRLASDYKEGTNFQDFKTFKVELNKSVFPKEAIPTDHIQLEQKIILKMQELGYQPSENPDFYIRYFVKKEMKEGRLHKGEDPDDFDYDYLVEVFTYKEGSLVLDFIESGSNRSLWHGVLTRTVEEIKRTSDKRMTRNVDAIFRKFAEDVNLKMEGKNV